MSAVMPDYDNFDLETAGHSGVSLDEAIAQAATLRRGASGFFVRVMRLGDGKFLPVKISEEEVFAEWSGKLQARLQKFRRRSAR